MCIYQTWCTQTHSVFKYVYPAGVNMGGKHAKKKKSKEERKKEKDRKKRDKEKNIQSCVTTYVA